MKKIEIDGEEYRMIREGELVPVAALTEGNDYRIIKKLPKESEKSPLEEFQGAEKIGSFSNGFAASSATANWLVDGLEKHLKAIEKWNPDTFDIRTGMEMVINEAKRLIGRK